MYYRKRKAALARKKAAELRSEDEEDYEQPGYDDGTDDSDPGHRPGKGQGAHLEVAKGPRRLLCTPLRMPMVVLHRRPPCN